MACCHTTNFCWGMTCVLSLRSQAFSTMRSPSAQRQPATLRPNKSRMWAGRPLHDHRPRARVRTPGH
eukprot:3568467-Lingulodinium_polyedra.AAC.1